MRLFSLVSASLAAALALSNRAAAQDECASAANIFLGTTPFDTTGATPSPGILVCGSGPSRDLWYRFVAPAARPYRISLCGSSFDTVVEVYQGSCGALSFVTCADDGCGTQSDLTFSAFTGRDYFVRVAGFGAQSFGAGAITIEESGVLPPVNDDRTNPLPLFEGSTPGSNVAATESFYGWACGAAIGADVWYYTIATGYTLQVEACGNTIDTAIQAHRHLSASATQGLGCSASNPSCAGGGGQLTIATQPGEIILFQVGGAQGAMGSFTLTLVGGHPFASSFIGASRCNPIPNSTGERGEIAAVGSVNVAWNDVTLYVRKLPAQTIGMFLVSDTPGATILGGANLCLGGVIGRYQGPSELFQTNATGSASLRIDLGSVPRGATSASVAPGETWYFQAWHRDLVGGIQSANLTSSIVVPFQ